MATYDNIKFTKGSDIVFIGTIKVEENYTNKITVVAKPTTNSTPETPLAINLNRFEDRFTIHGYINNGKLDATDTWTTAKAKKDGFKSMINQRETVTMRYENTDYTVAVDKFQITDDAMDNTDSEDGEVVYQVVISGVVAEDIV